MESIKKYARILLNILLPLAGILLVCGVVPKVLGYFMPFVVGWLIAMLANPLVRFLERRVKLVRKHGSVLIVVMALALVMGLGYFLVSRLLSQAFGLVKDLPEMYTTVSTVLEEFFQRFDEIYRFLPSHVTQAWRDFSGNVGQMIGLLLQKMASPTVEVAGNVAMKIPNAMVNVVVTILSSYFFSGRARKDSGILAKVSAKRRESLLSETAKRSATADKRILFSAI